jgi:hypothetical protein
LESNRNAFKDCEELDGEFVGIFERIEKALSEVRSIRAAIEDKFDELEGAS